MKDTDKFSPRDLTYGDVKELIRLVDGWSANKITAFFQALDNPRVDIKHSILVNEGIQEFMAIALSKISKLPSIVSKDSMYKSYCNYCVQSGVIAKTKYAFSRYLTSHYGLKVKKQRDGDKTFWVYVLEESNEIHETE